MSANDPVQMIQRASWNELLWLTLKGMIAEATDAGELYAERLPNTGEESVAWIGRDSYPYGFALFYEARPRTMWVDQLFVQAPYRRAGMGSRLLAAIEEHAKGLGYHAVEYGTRWTNHASRGLGARRGYDEPAVTLRLNIEPPPTFTLPPPSDGLAPDEIPF